MRRTLFLVLCFLASCDTNLEPVAPTSGVWLQASAYETSGDCPAFVLPIFEDQLETLWVEPVDNQSVSIASGPLLDSEQQADGLGAQAFDVAGVLEWDGATYVITADFPDRFEPGDLEGLTAPTTLTTTIQTTFEPLDELVARVSYKVEVRCEGEGCDAVSAALAANEPSWQQVSLPCERSATASFEWASAIDDTPVGSDEPDAADDSDLPEEVLPESGYFDVTNETVVIDDCDVFDGDFGFLGTIFLEYGGETMILDELFTLYEGDDEGEFSAVIERSEPTERRGEPGYYSSFVQIETTAGEPDEASFILSFVQDDNVVQCISQARYAVTPSQRP